MKRFLIAGCVFVAIAGPGWAATITHHAFAEAVLATHLAAAQRVEDFEDPDRLTYRFEGDGPGRGAAAFAYGELDAALRTSVGTFRAYGSQTGSGSTCRAFDLTGDGRCDNIALQFDRSLNGQGNVAPDAGHWSLNSNDTLGIVWDAFLPDGGRFSAVVFAVQDAADAGAQFTVSVGEDSLAFPRLPNNNRQIVRIEFDAPVNAAEIVLWNSRTNDAFTLDAVAIAAVPVPASAVLLLGGLAALGGMAWRRLRVG